MFIFYGLGNNSLEYLATKHNLGRLVLEELAKIWELEFCSQKSYYFCKTSVDEHKLFLLYSSGFMNNSGLPLLDLIQYFKLQNSIKLLVILQDDSDQLEGNFKLLPKGGSAGHRGIDSIYQHIENLKIPDKNIWRLKIGIRPINNKQKSETFVLHRINDFEKEKMIFLAKFIATNINFFLEGNLNKLQTKLHTK